MIEGEYRQLVNLLLEYVLEGGDEDNIACKDSKLDTKLRSVYRMCPQIFPSKRIVFLPNRHPRSAICQS